MNKNIMKKLQDFEDFEDYLIDSLKDPIEASIYLNVIIDEYMKDNDIRSFLRGLKNVAKAQGGLSKLSESTGLNRQNLYRTLSAKGNPRISTVRKILNSFGCDLYIKPIGST